METPILGSPKTLLERAKSWYKNATGHERQEVIRIVAGVTVVVVGSLFTNLMLAPKYWALKDELNTKDTKITQLNIELTPFRTAALLAFGNGGSNGLARLAEQVTKLVKQFNTLDDITKQTEASSKRSEAALNKLQRRIPPEERKDLEAALQNLPKVPVAIRCQSITAEAKTFAVELHQLFEKAGFKPTLTIQDYIGWPINQAIEVNSAEHPPACALLVQELFKRSRYPWEGKVDRSLPTNSVRITIGLMQPDL